MKGERLELVTDFATLRAGFEVKEIKPAPHPLTCDECPPERAEP